MREGHCLHEQFLESRFGRRFDLYDGPGRRLELIPERLRQQGPNSATTRCVADRSDAREWTVRNKAQHHRVKGIDMGTEGSGQTDVGEITCPRMINKEIDSGT